MAEEPTEESRPAWLAATLNDLNEVEIDEPIRDSRSADCGELSEQFLEAHSNLQATTEASETARLRIYALIGAVTGMFFRPGQPNEPFAPMLRLADGRRTAAPEDFRGAPLDVLATAAERTTNIVLQARLSDLCWALDRRHGRLATKAVKAYTEIAKQLVDGQLTLSGAAKPPLFEHRVRDYIRRALQLGRSIGWNKPETKAARDLAMAFRQKAATASLPLPLRMFSELDLDYGISPPETVGIDIEKTLHALSTELDTHTKYNLWKIAARAYHVAKRDDDKIRCSSEAAECLVVEATSLSSNSSLLASNSLSRAIAELHGIPGKRARRKELQHRLVDLQSGISDEMNLVEHSIDAHDIAKLVRDKLSKPRLVEKLSAFSHLAQSPQPGDLISEAVKSIREHPLSSLFGSSHHDSDGKVVFRTAGGGLGDTHHPTAIAQQIAQHERIRRNLVAFEIEIARRCINDKHYISTDVFVRILEFSFVVPPDLIWTFSCGFERFFRGDFVSATYILTPLLENSLRHVLKANGHDVTKFDDATQTQQDRTISSLFEQQRNELETAFTSAIITDIENTFLRPPGPCLRHKIAHGLLQDGGPYGDDARYACWLIMRICLVPALHHAQYFARELDMF